MEEIEFPTYKLSLDLVEKIRSRYKEKFSVYPEQDDTLSSSIEWASDFYIKNPSAQSPWEKEAFQKAYLCYYLPKNILRLKGVISRLQQVGFFAFNFERLVEWGSGNGAFDLALQESSFSFSKKLFIERSESAIKEHQYFSTEDVSVWQKEGKPESAGKDFLIFSYSLTELDTLPQWIFNFSNILIVEPSTQQDGRRLMAWRDNFLEKEYHIWAPCTHQGSCPLLESKTDWCHDNYSVEYPPYLDAIKSKLKLSLNRPATSYLALSKRPNSTSPDLVRVVGNTLKERGKTKQLICRSSEREFFSWFNKREEVPEIPRGSLIELLEEPLKKSNELRLGKNFKYFS